MSMPREDRHAWLAGFAAGLAFLLLTAALDGRDRELTFAERMERQLAQHGIKR